MTTTTHLSVLCITLKDSRRININKNVPCAQFTESRTDRLAFVIIIIIIIIIITRTIIISEMTKSRHTGDSIRERITEVMGLQMFPENRY